MPKAFFRIITLGALTACGDATGVAGHFRIYDSDSVVILQGTAGAAADSPDMVFDDKNIVIGGTIAISSLTVTVPEQ